MDKADATFAQTAAVDPPGALDQAIEDAQVEQPEIGVDIEADLASSRGDEVGAAVGRAARNDARLRAGRAG